VTSRLIVDDGGVVDVELPRHRPHGTSTRAVGTRLLSPEFWQLLPQGLLDRPLDHRPSGSDSDLLQSIEGDIKARAIIPERSTGDDFSPPLGQRADLILTRRRGAFEGHDEHLLGLGAIEKMGNCS
jgi:hypothetical protein